jgi:hypothetical protein
MMRAMRSCTRVRMLLRWYLAGGSSAPSTPRIAGTWRCVWVNVGFDERMRDLTLGYKACRWGEVVVR